VTDDFRCPRCGGWAFGMDLDTRIYRCNSDAAGVPLSEKGHGRPCRWKGRVTELLSSGADEPPRRRC
jgi:hypothetical protein